MHMAEWFTKLNLVVLKIYVVDDEGINSAMFNDSKKRLGRGGVYKYLTKNFTSSQPE